MPMWHRRGQLVVPGVVLAAAVSLGGCAHRTADPPAPRYPTLDAAAPARSFDPVNVARGPGRPEIGRTYPFDLYVHCAGEYTGFGGYVWKTDAPPGDPLPSPDANGVTSYTGYLAGWMTQTGPDTAVFRSGSRLVEYHRVASAPGCD
jgi:hypothetical protein